MLTPERLAEIKARAEALGRHATDGEWRYDGGESVHVWPPDGGDCELVASVWGESGSDEEHALGEFTAHAREDVPALLAEVKRLRADNERLIKGISHAHHALGKGWTVSPHETLAELLRGERPC